MPASALSRTPSTNFFLCSDIRFTVIGLTRKDDEAPQARPDTWWTGEFCTSYVSYFWVDSGALKSGPALCLIFTEPKVKDFWTTYQEIAGTGFTKGWFLIERRLIIR
jgi:hypothetical protein